MIRIKHIVYNYANIDSVADRLTILNFCKFPCVLMSRSWFRSVISFNMLDSCCFDIVVSDSEYKPIIPVLYESFT